jgi:uncharacterized protein (TIGR03435 family)
MFERYTEPARRMLFFARYEASRLGSLSIESEHLLLGLFREGTGLTSRVFAGAQVRADDVRREVEGRSARREQVPTSVEIPFSTESKRILQYAAQESDRLLHDYIGTEHLLLGILREERSLAATILKHKGMRLDVTRDNIVQLLNGAASDEAAAGRPTVDALAPSSELHVAPSSYHGHPTTGGPDYWTASGFSLRSVLARVFATDERRVELPADLDTEQRYDFALRLPDPETRQRMERRVVEGLASHFGISIARESREQDVHVLTAPDGPTAALRSEEPISGGGGGFGSFDVATRADGLSEPDLSREERVSFGNLRMSGMTIDDLCRTLEEMFGTPFVDETKLSGTYAVTVAGEFSDAAGFFDAMRDQLGLLVTPARRALETIVVRRT